MLSLLIFPLFFVVNKNYRTWAFWSPEMCAEDSLLFSGYTCDIWAAGICLYIFATGKLPFYSEIPMALFDMIADANVKLDEMKLSDALFDMLNKVLTKYPYARAGVGDCLKHQFCEDAREQRINELGAVVETNDDIFFQRENKRESFLATKQKNRSISDLARSFRGQFTSLRKKGEISRYHHH